jgi:hypothetical protein
MAKEFQHQVCYSVSDRVTFVNGVWQGADVPEAERTHQDVEACPLVWDYLQRAGAVGWELVCVLETHTVVNGQPFVRTLFLKRERPGRA